MPGLVHADQSWPWPNGTPPRRSPRRGSDAELLADQAVDLAAVGAALGLAHDRADERARSPWRCRRGCARRRPGCRRSPAATMPASSSPPPIAAEALALDDRGRVAALGDQPSSTDARRCRRHRARLRRARRARPARPASTAPGLLGARAQLGDPVGDRRAARPSSARGRRLEVVAPLAARRRAAARCRPAAPQLALVARGARRRAARAAPRAPRRSISSRRRDAGRGRAPGSSGSRAPPPWSAASSAARSRGSKCSVSWTTGSPASSSAIWRSISALMPCSRKRNEFMFLSSVLVPSSVEPAGPHGDVGVAAQRALLHVHVARRRAGAASRAAASSHSRACSAEWMSGSVTISASGVPPRL